MPQVMFRFKNITQKHNVKNNVNLKYEIRQKLNTFLILTLTRLLQIVLLNPISYILHRNKNFILVNEFTLYKFNIYIILLYIFTRLVS